MEKKQNPQIDPKKLQEAFAVMKKMADSSEDFSDYLGKSDGFIQSISNQLFGINKSEFFQKVKVSKDDFAEMVKEVDVLAEDFQNLAVNVDKGFTEALKKSFGKMGQLSDSVADLGKSMPNIAKQIEDAISSKNFSKLTTEAKKQFRELVNDKEGLVEMKEFLGTDFVKDMEKNEKATDDLKGKMALVGQEVFSWDASFNAIGKRLTEGFNLKKVAESVGDFDQVLSDAQKDSGIMFKNNSSSMEELSGVSLQYGMGIKENTELMSKLGEGLRTTDFGLLGKAAGDMQALVKATGLSINEVGELGTNFMIMGRTSKDLSEFSLKVMQDANNFGVNGREIMQGIAKNIPKFRQMGFKGGEESLSNMILLSKHLGQNVDEIFDMAGKARNIEGALEMASQLQLAGGSFANINPMDLLKKARESPAELSKLLAKMGSDIGTFNKETKEMDFSAADIDRLGIVSDATKMSIDSLQKQISQTYKDAQKIAKIPAGMFNGLSDKEKMFLLKSLDENGNVKMSIDGLDDINKINKSNIDNAIKQENMKKGSLEEQAQQNISFKESVKNFKDSIMNAFVIFEPFIEGLTSFVQGLNKVFSVLDRFIPGAKIAFALGVAGIALIFSAAKQFESGLFFGRGAKAGMEGKSMLSNPFKKRGGGLSKIDGASDIPEGGKPDGFLTSLAKGLEAFGDKAGKILLGAATLAASSLMIGGALILITAGIAKFGGDASGGQLVTFGTTLVLLASSMYLMSKIFKGLDIEDIAIGSLGMLMIGTALIPFSFSMSLLKGIDWTAIAAMGIGILALTAIVFGLGVVMDSGIGAVVLESGALFLVSLGLAMLGVGAGLVLASQGFSAMANVDWSSLTNMSGALMSISLAGSKGIVGMIGIVGMSMSLGALADVMSVLAITLPIAATAMSQMASSVTELKEAVKGLDVAKLSQLSDASERLSTGSFLSNISGALSNLTGGGKQDNEVKVKLEPITINLQLSGRQIQQIIIDDTKLIS